MHPAYIMVLALSLAIKTHMIVPKAQQWVKSASNLLFEMLWEVIHSHMLNISKMSIVCGRLFVSVTDTTDPQTEKY